MKAVIYTTTTCPYCMMAKELLEREGIPFEERVVEFGSEELMQLIEKTNHRTVPQIFLDDEFVGGFDDLQAHLRNK